MNYTSTPGYDDTSCKVDTLLQKNTNTEHYKKRVPAYIIVSVTCMQIMRRHYEKYKAKQDKGSEKAKK